MFPILETERCILRSISACDLLNIHNCWMNDPLISKYMWWQASDDISNTKRFVTNELENVNNPEWIRWIIELKDTKEICGTALLYWNEDENSYDISYNLGRRYWKNGYMLEAMQAVLDYARKRNISIITTCYAKENVASMKLLRKLGFTYVMDIDYSCGENTILPGEKVALKL